MDEVWNGRAFYTIENRILKNQEKKGKGRAVAGLKMEKLLNMGLDGNIKIKVF